MDAPRTLGNLVHNENTNSEYPSELSSSNTFLSELSLKASGSNASKSNRAKSSVIKPDSAAKSTREEKENHVETSLNLQTPASESPNSMTIVTNKPTSSSTADNFAVPAPVSKSRSVIPSKKRRTKPRRSRITKRKRNKKIKKTVPHLAAECTMNHPTADLGRWKPTDDLALVTNVQQTNDLEMVHEGVKFSCRFTLQEVQSRWHHLLHDTYVSRIAIQAMRMLHPDAVAAIQRKTLFSKDEENILETINSNSQPSLEIFEKLLQANLDTFHPARTAKKLMNHWQLMKNYELLPDQSVRPLPRSDDIMSFSEAEANLADSELSDDIDEILREMTRFDRRNKREMRVLEQELKSWLMPLDVINHRGDINTLTLAILKGKTSKFQMQSLKISIGRSTQDSKVDVDLALEGPAEKVSRRHATICMKSNGRFMLSAEGKRPIFVNGKTVLPGTKVILYDHSLIEIAGFQLVFLMNQELVLSLRANWVDIRNQLKLPKHNIKQ